jgi:hypothetical protein
MQTEAVKALLYQQGAFLTQIWRQDPHPAQHLSLSEEDFVQDSQEHKGHGSLPFDGRVKSWSQG